MSVSDLSLPVRVWPAIIRAVSGRCPACGSGKFFKSYLRQVDRCSVCGESFGQIHADDGPAWLTIGMVGHIVVPMAPIYRDEFSVAASVQHDGLAAVVVVREPFFVVDGNQISGSQPPHVHLVVSVCARRVDVDNAVLDVGDLHEGRLYDGAPRLDT